MDSYLIFVGVALATILLPGPAVVFTLNNSIQRGMSKTLAGILGVSLAILFVAVLSATSIGILLANSLTAFAIVKIIGAIYLIYIGIKMLRSKGEINQSAELQQTTHQNCFFEGFFVSLSNPKAIIFFMSIFPQFIDTNREYISQFTFLACTFCMLVLVVHSSYAVFATLARKKLSTTKGKERLNKISGSIFICFGIGLSATSE